MANRKNNTLPDIQEVINQTKYEVAAELGVNLGADATARENGKVGGYFGGPITKNLVAKALQQMPDE